MTTGTSPTTEPPTRPPPRIVRVPPPVASASSFYPKVVIVVLWAVFAVVPWAIGFRPGALLALLGFSTLAVLAYVLFRPHVLRTRLVGARARCVVQCPEWRDDPLGASLADRWNAHLAPPRLRAIRRMLERLPKQGPGAAVVVCLGVAEVPAVCDARFEPEIIAPVCRWREMLSAAVCAAVMGVVGFNCISGIAGWHYSALLGSLASALVFVALIGVFWVGQTVLFPEYARFAPGMIQILYYRPGRSTPAVVSYPMTAGTVAVVTAQHGGRREKLSLSIARGNNADVLDLSKVRTSSRAIERMWQALLSTAPTPPLSDEELVG